MKKLEKILLFKKNIWINFFFIFFFSQKKEKSKLQKKIIGKLKVFDPSNRLILFWKLVTCLLIFFEFFSITIELFFHKTWLGENLQEDFRRYLLIIMILDFLVSLNTGIYESGSVIYNRKIIFKRYMNSFFLSDFLSVMSLSLKWNDNFDKNSDVSKSPGLMSDGTSAFRLLFSLKLGQVTSILKAAEDSLFNDEMYSGIIALIKLCLQILFLTHLTACLWTFSSIYEDRRGSPCWIQKRFENDTVQSVSWLRLYLYSLYWSLATIVTVGYGDISPQNDSEVLVSCFAMLFGSGFFAYSINTMGFIVEKFDLHKKNLRWVIFINKHLASIIKKE